MSRREESNLYSSLVLRLHHLDGTREFPVAFTIFCYTVIYIIVGKDRFELPTHRFT